MWLTLNNVDVVSRETIETIDTLDYIASDLHFLTVKTYVFEIFIVVCIGVLIVIGLCKLFDYVFRSLA